LTKEYDSCSNGFSETLNLTANLISRRYYLVFKDQTGLAQDGRAK